MTQGLCMFDAQEKLVVCNERYLKMYDLPADIVKPGCSLAEILRAAQGGGQFLGRYRHLSLEVCGGNSRMANMST